MRDDVVVIGGGLAGSEAAWQATSNPRRPAGINAGRALAHHPES